MHKIVIIGGGWSGCAAALAAKKAGADVLVLEKTDMLLGLGNVGGIMRNNGRFTATEENIAMGAHELFHITDRNSRHINVDFPGHNHASLYDVMKVEPEVKCLLEEKGIHVRTICRAVDVKMDTDGKGRRYLKRLIMSDGEEIDGDAFVECTGSTGPMGNCLTYGNGCCMCILRCPAFGPRVSITQKAGNNDIMGRRRDGAFGAFSGSGKLEKGSLSEELQQQLNEIGVAVVPVNGGDNGKTENAVRSGDRKFAYDKLNMKVCQQYALDAYAENIILLDTGYAKLMTPYYPLDKLRKIPGFENARYADPYAGGKGNSIRYLSVAERDNSMKVDRIENMFCGGEKSGLFVGHTEAISTGSLAGHNAARYLKGLKPLILPPQIAIGDMIAYANEQLSTKDGLMTRYTFAGAEFFERMKERNLYLTDREIIFGRVKKWNLDNVYDEKIL